jgi:hypothetical protein
MTIVSLTIRLNDSKTRSNDTKIAVLVFKMPGADLFIHTIKPLSVIVGLIIRE